jgi:hypothetical protein
MVSQNDAPMTVVIHLIWDILFHAEIKIIKIIKIKAFGMSLLHYIAIPPRTMPYSQEKQRGG